MNPFVQAAKELIYPNAETVSVIQVVEGTYSPATGAVTNTETSYSIKAYPKKVKATSYNYPNLVGKEVIEFIIVSSDLSFTPAPTDRILRAGLEYAIEKTFDVSALGDRTITYLVASRG